MLHLFVGLKDLPFFGEILPHVHYLVHIVTLEVDYLLEGFLVHVNHLHILREVHLLPVILQLWDGLRKLLRCAILYEIASESVFLCRVLERLIGRRTVLWGLLIWYVGCLTINL